MVSKTVRNLSFLKTKTLNQWDAEKSRKADQGGFKNFMHWLWFKVAQLLSDFFAFSASH